MLIPTSNDAHLNKIIEIAEESYTILNRIKNEKKFYVPSEGKIFVANKTEDTSGFKLYTDANDYNVTYNYVPCTYFIRANHPKTVFSGKSKYSVMENAEILYISNVINEYNNKTKLYDQKVDGYLNPDCPNFGLLFNRNNNSFKKAMETLSKVPFVTENTHLLPDWAKDFMVLS